ncbi:hypothetical protein ABIB94_008051 [Bradyrhizobium sp. JR7.2]
MDHCGGGGISNPPQLRDHRRLLSGRIDARANAVLNVLHFGWAFLVQYGTGLILEQWPAKDGHCPSIAYQTAFSINVLLQLAALVWFIAPRIKELNWKSQIALKRKSTDQSRSVHVVIPSAGLVILETDRDVEW